MAGLPEILELFELKLPISPRPSDGCPDEVTSQAVLIRASAEDGKCGWGLGQLTGNITGETIESVTEDLQSIFWPAICQAASVEQLGEAVVELPWAEGDRLITTARCAVESAIISACDPDWLTPVKKHCDSFSHTASASVELIPAAGEIIAAASEKSAADRAVILAKHGRRNIRVCLSGDHQLDEAMFSSVAAAMEKAFPDKRFILWADAGGKWKYNEVPDRAEAYARMGCSAIKDPCPVRIGVMTHLAYDCPLPIIADTSCITPEQLEVALGAEGRIWPLISIEKCGGLAVAAEMAISSAASRTPWVLGSNPLASALATMMQRTLIINSPPPALLESGGSYDRLADDILHPRPRCGFGGRLPYENSDYTTLRLAKAKFKQYTTQLLKLEQDTTHSR